MIFTFETQSGVSIPRSILLADLQGAVAYLQRRGMKIGANELAVIALDRREARLLNWKARRRRYAANVLSFNYGTQAEIVIAPAVIRNEAKAAGNSPREQLRWMVVHGLVHIVGIHHETNTQTLRRFRDIELRLLRKLGVTLRHYYS